jgi:tubulin--tyrosine ligase
MKAYFYRDGYIRTSSKEFSMNNLYNKYVHLVNDAVQKYGEDYGKYEPGNKLTYCEL